MLLLHLPPPQVHLDLAAAGSGDEVSGGAVAREQGRAGGAGGAGAALLEEGKGELSSLLNHRTGPSRRELLQKKFRRSLNPAVSQNNNIPDSAISPSRSYRKNVQQAEMKKLTSPSSQGRKQERGEQGEKSRRRGRSRGRGRGRVMNNMVCRS